MFPLSSHGVALILLLTLEPPKSPAASRQTLLVQSFRSRLLRCCAYPSKSLKTPRHAKNSGCVCNVAFDNLCHSSHFTRAIERRKRGMLGQSFGKLKLLSIWGLAI